MSNQAEHDSLVGEFCSMSGASPEQATQYLEAHSWDLMAASNSFFQDQDEAQAQGDDQTPPQPRATAADSYTGPRTLDGRPAPQASSSRPSRKAPVQQKKKGVATLGSLGGGSSSHQHGHDDEDDEFEDSDDNDGRGNLFAGGEKSGLAVQDPNKEGGPKKIISDILAKAKANAANPEATNDAESSRAASRFRGTGMTLGGEGTESRSIPDPLGPRSADTTPQERILHIWEDGFSIDDGELRRFDDPAHQMDLQMIRSGRAPLHLMNVSHDQPVDVKLHQHEGPYTEQPKKYKPFGGSGRRLGSPVPGDGNEPSIAQVSSQVPTAAAGGSTADTAPVVDQSQPVITLRLQLPDGTRLPARFNTTHTVGDVYTFIRGASTELASRPWVLATTFPNKEHTDKSLVLGEMSEFKKGGTAVVKWT